MGLRSFPHFLQDESADLAGAVLFATHLNPGIAIGTRDDPIGHHTLVFRRDRIIFATTDQPLDREDRIFWIGNGLPLGCLADEDAITVCESDNRRRRARAFGIFDDLGLLAVHDCNAGVRRSEIDADCSGHVRGSLLTVIPLAAPHHLRVAPSVDDF